MTLFVKRPARKIFGRMILTVALAAFCGSCDLFKAVRGGDTITSKGRPYEMIIVCGQDDWNGMLGDSLRAIFRAPVPYINQTEPLFDVLRVTGQGYTGMVSEHRNILETVVDPTLESAAAAVRHDLRAQPQIVVTLQGPTSESITAYASDHRAELVQVFEAAERDRTIRNTERYFSAEVDLAVREIFGFEMRVPLGYKVARREGDFLWARFEYPQASQGFFVYSYPYIGREQLTAGSLIKARNAFAAHIPGPSEGSYMTTSEAFEPDCRIFRLEGRTWVEMRGFWDVAGDFMGGPFVSYTTIDTSSNRVVTIDGYVYSPKLNKRNFVRGVEHLLYSVHFEEDPAASARAEQPSHDRETTE